MGYADADVKNASSAAGAGFAVDEEGFRAALSRKRHSLFGRPESMSSFIDSNAPPLTTTGAQVQGVLYHNLSDREQAVAGNQKAKEAVENRRKSFFGGRFRFGGKKVELHQHQQQQQQPKKDSSPPKLELVPRPLHIRGLSSPADVADQREQHISEDEYYRNRTKSTISPPFNFQHVTHTRKKHLPALETVDEKDLTKEFWAASAHQIPKRQLQGIQAVDLSAKLETMGVMKGAVSSRPTTPVKAERPKPPPPIPADNPARSSREDITALPGIEKPKRSGSKSRRDELSALLGLREKGGSFPPDTAHASVMARADTYNALLGIKSDAPSVKSGKDSMTSLLGLPEKSPKPSIESARQTERAREDSKRFSGAFRAQKVSTESSRPSKKEISSLLGFKERSMSESSSKSKKEDVNALLGIPDKKRHSRTLSNQDRRDEIDALLGMPKRQSKKFEPMAPPAPPRPRRSDEELRPSPGLPPDRPRRDSKDVQYLREMGFGQLLYRENSNESRQGSSLHRAISNESQGQKTHRQNSIDSYHTQPMLRQGSNDSRYGQPMYRQDSNEPRHSPNPSISQSPHSPQVLFDTRRPSQDQHTSYGSANPAADDLTRAQQMQYKARQPLPAIPRQANTPEGRSPLQTVSEVGESYTPLRTPTDSAISPRSLNSLHSAHRPVRSPELTGPSIPDDEAWEHEIDFLYSKEAEATNDFDWDAVSMTPQRLSVREVDKRLSLNIPSDAVPAALRLSKKLSEGSLRTSLYVPSPLQTQYSPSVRQQAPRKHIAHLDARYVDPVVSAARGSPEVKVVDVDEKRSDGYAPGSLHMHGYESIAAGYLSDPESNSERSQHRKSNSYSSWESRPSAAKDQIRHSNASLTSIPDLMHTRRQPKQPITHIEGLQPQYQDLSPHPMNEYAAFSKGPYAQQEEEPAVDYVSVRRPENISQNTIFRAAVIRTAKDSHDAHRWSRVLPAAAGPALAYPQEQQASWL